MAFDPKKYKVSAPRKLSSKQVEKMKAAVFDYFEVVGELKTVDFNHDTSWFKDDAYSYEVFDQYSGILHKVMPTVRRRPL